MTILKQNIFYGRSFAWEMLFQRTSGGGSGCSKPLPSMNKNE